MVAIPLCLSCMSMLDLLRPFSPPCFLFGLVFLSHTGEKMIKETEGG